VSDRTISANASLTTAQLAPDSTILVGVTAASAPSSRRTVVNALWRCGFLPLLPPETGDLKPSFEAARAYVEVLAHLPSVRAESAIRQALNRQLPTFLFVNADLLQNYQQPCEIIPFRTPDELGTLIVRRLTALLPLLDPSAALNLHAPYTEPIPAQPAPYLAHPHYLTRRLVGRAAELNALRAWLERGAPVLALTGEDGIGKSALVWHWLLEERLNTPDQPIMLWDFAESNGGFANFVRHALAYFGQLPLSAVNELPRAERLNALLRALAERRALLVLENAQQLLSRSDEVLPANAEILAFLSALPSFAQLKTLLIASALPSVYRDGSDVQHLPLGALSAADAEQLLSQLVLHSEAETLQRCATTLGRHPLSLCMAAENGNAHPSGFDAWWQAHAERFERAQTLSERLTALVEVAVAELARDGRALLHYLSALRFPVPHAMFLRHSAFYIELPRSAEMPQARSEQPDAAAQARLHTVLSDLERRALLLWDRATNRYALHPLVRGAVQATWLEEEREAALNAARRALEPLAAEIPDTLHDESDLRAAIELYMTRLSAEETVPAALFYRERLSKPLLTRLADAQVVLQLLLPFFRDGIQAPPALGSVKERAYIGNEMALALSGLDRLAEARHLLEQTLPLFIEAREPHWLCTALVNYGGLLEEQCALRVRVFELARKLATAIGDVENQAVANFVLLRLYVELGQWTAAAEAYEAFSNSAARYRTMARQATAERLVAQMLLEQGQDPSGALNLAWEFAVQSDAVAEKRAIHALWGEFALSLMARPDAAERFFEEALRMAANNVSLVAQYRGGLARAYALQGRRDEALALLVQGVPSLAAAQVHLTFGETASAEAAALDAYRQAWREGTPFSRWWELERARAILRALRVPPPDLPPYHPENFPQLPSERAIRMYVIQLERGAQTVS
jgi:hypothetical protein